MQLSTKDCHDQIMAVLFFTLAASEMEGWLVYNIREEERRMPAAIHRLNDFYVKYFWEARSASI